jgi:long-subunit fatty acid transport protein
MRRTFLILTLLTLTLSASWSKAETEGGGMPGAFLQLSYSARAGGMGGAFVGVADDAEAGLINPAGVIILDKRYATASYRRMDLDRKLSFISYAQNLKDKDAGMSVSWINVGVSEIEERNSNGEITGDIRYYENLIALTFGKRIAQKLLLGVNLKYDQANLANVSTNGLGFDFGALWGENTPYRFGLAVYNVGLSHKWTTGD